MENHNDESFIDENKYLFKEMKENEHENDQSHDENEVEVVNISYNNSNIINNDIFMDTDIDNIYSLRSNLLSTTTGNLNLTTVIPIKRKKLFNVSSIPSLTNNRKQSTKGGILTNLSNFHYTILNNSTNVSGSLYNSSVENRNLNENQNSNNLNNNTNSSIINSTNHTYHSNLNSNTKNYTHTNTYINNQLNNQNNNIKNTNNNPSSSKQKAKKGRKKQFLDGVKREILEKAFIREFKSYIKINDILLKQLYNDLKTDEKQFWNIFLNQSSTPPFVYYNSNQKRIEFKSFSNDYMKFMFSYTSVRILYETFIKDKEIEVVNKIFSKKTKTGRSGNEDFKREIVYYALYGRNLHKVYSVCESDNEYEKLCFEMGGVENLNLKDTNLLYNEPSNSGSYKKSDNYIEKRRDGNEGSIFNYSEKSTICKSNFCHEFYV